MELPGTEPISMDQANRAVRACAHPAAVLRSDLTIIAANEKYSRLFVGPGSEVLGRRCFRISHGYSRSCDEMGECCPVRQSIESGEVVEVIHQHYTRRGKEAERVIMYPLRGTNGAVDGFLEILYPLEERRRNHERLIGSAPPFRRMMNLIERVAPSEIPVLLVGESGTGKELVAREVHDRSSRAKNPFVPVDCSGLPETLFESELFGHERGAFTGASHPKKGLVEAAARGTLFLDEVGDIPLSQQVKLLRLLETGLYRRVGSTEQKKSDFRLICATHRDLRSMVQHGTFRRDLYYRINAFPIETPPLRERQEDIEVLSEELLLRIQANDPLLLSPEALVLLERHCFPGNVRELLNILQRASLLSDDGAIRPEHLPEEIVSAEPAAECQGGRGIRFYGDVLPLEEVERLYLQWVSSTFDGERRDLADRLGVSERTLYRKLSEL